MEEKELISIAKLAIKHNLDYSDLKYSDYLYSNEQLVDEVWFFVEEYTKMGSLAFYNKYPD